MRITIDNPALKTAAILDLNGVKKKEDSLASDGAKVSYTFPPAAKYVVLE